MTSIVVFRISPDHNLIQQMKLVLNDIYSIIPKMISHSSPWPLSSVTAFQRKQLKRTISLPLIGGKHSSILLKIERSISLELTNRIFG